MKDDCPILKVTLKIASQKNRKFSQVLRGKFTGDVAENSATVPSVGAYFPSSTKPVEITYRDGWMRTLWSRPRRNMQGRSMSLVRCPKPGLAQEISVIDLTNSPEAEITPKLDVETVCKYRASTKPTKAAVPYAGSATLTS